VAAIDNIDPDPVADEGGSWLPLLAVLVGAAMLFLYFRSRKKASRRGSFSGSRTSR
jgi:LPXTG-motif cell wall-anchored protein